MFAVRRQKAPITLNSWNVTYSLLFIIYNGFALQRKLIKFGGHRKQENCDYVNITSIKRLKLPFKTLSLPLFLICNNAFPIMV